MSETKLQIDALVPYPNHPFALYEGKRMDDLVESIRENGMISPVIVRPIDENKYEILSGHNRVEASKRLRLVEIPAIIKLDLSDDEAALIITESNLIQRSFADMKHSERAVVLKNHLEALKKLSGQGKRNDLLDFLNDDSSGQVAHKSKSRDKVAERYALSEKTVRRYVRLAKLPKKLLEKVDEDKIKFIPAVELSWLSENELNILAELLEKEDVKISLKQAQRLREESEKVKGSLKKEDISSILNEKSERGKSLKVDLSDEVYERFTGYGEFSKKVVENIIALYLDMLERGEVDDLFGKENELAEMG